MALKTKLKNRIRTKPLTGKLTKKAPAKLNAEQQAKLDAVDAMIARRQARWDSLSPVERERETKDHDRMIEELRRYPSSLREYMPD